MNVIPYKTMHNVMKKVRSNYCYPSGILGKLMLTKMNHGSSAAMARWGLKNLTIGPSESILDIGCGGGANIKRMLALSPDGYAMGVDISSCAISMSEAYNKKAITQERCDLMKVSVSSLPFADGTFSLVTAFNSVLLWPGPTRSFRQVWAVLNRGGRFLIVNHEYRNNGEDVAGLAKLTLDIPYYPAHELEYDLRSAGFVNIKVFRDAKRHNLCMIAYKS